MRISEREENEHRRNVQSQLLPCTWNKDKTNVYTDCEHIKSLNFSKSFLWASTWLSLHVFIPKGLDSIFSMEVLLFHLKTPLEFTIYHVDRIGGLFDSHLCFIHSVCYCFRHACRPITYNISFYFTNSHQENAGKNQRQQQQQQHWSRSHKHVWDDNLHQHKMNAFTWFPLMCGW